jgi:hypothetical protein
MIIVQKVKEKQWKDWKKKKQIKNDYENIS